MDRKQMVSPTPSTDLSVYLTLGVMKLTRSCGQWVHGVNLTIRMDHTQPGRVRGTTNGNLHTKPPTRSISLSSHPAGPLLSPGTQCVKLSSANTHYGLDRAQLELPRE